MNQIVVVGHKGVGKSSLISHLLKSGTRSVEEDTSEDQTPTDWYRKCNLVHCPSVIENEVTLFRAFDFVDTSDLEQDLSLLELHMNFADAFLLMLDVTRMEETILVVKQFCKHLFTKLLPVCGRKPDIMVLANKINLVDDNYYHGQQMRLVQDLCENYDIPYLQTSVKTGENLDVALGEIVNMVEKHLADIF